MSFAQLLPTSLLMAVGGVVIGVASPVAAEPDVNGQSAATVIDQFQSEGYAVSVNGSPAGDPALLTTCTVTSVSRFAADTAKTVALNVACPLTHG